MRVVLASLHFDEEPCLSGQRGSGTMFLAGCNARCVYCQNHFISQHVCGQVLTKEQWLAVAQALVAAGAHNLNLVSPTPYAELLIDWLPDLRQRTTVPIIWNSNGYETPETIARLAGLVDIYLPDLKYADDQLAQNYSHLPHYFASATAAILAMRAQIGPNVFKDGLMTRGLIIRHLVLPAAIENTTAVLDWIYIHLGPEALVSLMAQYYPTYRAADWPALNRKLTAPEYAEVEEYFTNLGFRDGYIQELAAATADYTPAFPACGGGLRLPSGFWSLPLS